MALPRNYVIGLVIFCIFIFGGMWLIGDFGINDASTSSFNNTFYVYNDIASDISSIRNSTEKAETDFGAFGVLNSLINSAWVGLKVLFHTGDITSALADDVSNFFHIPFEILMLISLIVIVVIAFAIWGAIFQRDL